MKKRTIFSVFLLLNLLLGGNCRKKPTYPGTKSNQRLPPDRDVVDAGLDASSSTNSWPSSTISSRANQTISTPSTVKNTSVFTSTGDSTTTSNKKNYRHNEASPDAITSTTKLILNKKPFGVTSFSPTEDLIVDIEPDPTMSTTPSYDPFEDDVTLRIGAFFEGPDMERLTTKFMALLNQELARLEDEFRASRLKKLDLSNKDHSSVVEGILRELQFSSVFGKVRIEGLSMEMPTFDESSIAKMCRMMHSKNVITALGLGSIRNIYTTALLAQSSEIPLVTATYASYADEEAFQVRISITCHAEVAVIWHRSVI